jgi:hypothetical protein
MRMRSQTKIWFLAVACAAFMLIPSMSGCGCGGDVPSAAAANKALEDAKPQPATDTSKGAKTSKNAKNLGDSL